VRDAKAKKLGEFLKAKRSQSTPTDLGLPESGHRRVSGLRRDEVAAQASISTDHYLRIEQGRRNPSGDVLESIAKVLKLSPEEREYVSELSRGAGGTESDSRRGTEEPALIPAAVSQAMHSMAIPALIHNGRFDFLAANRLGRALYADLLERQPVEPNLARFTFLDPFSREYLLDWGDIADQVVASLRWEVARSPLDDELGDFIAELVTSGDEFTRRWESQNVGTERPGSKRVNHPVVGPMTLNYASMEIQGSNGLFLSTFTAEPGSSSEEALRSLDRWAATQEPRSEDPGYEEVRSTTGRGL
jgi:transcriptional regulator with XRE-family HTH domain